MWVAASACVVCTTDIPRLSTTLSRRAIMVPHQEPRTKHRTSMQTGSGGQKNTTKLHLQAARLPQEPGTKHLTGMQTAKSQLRLYVDPFGNQYDILLCYYYALFLQYYY